MHQLKILNAYLCLVVLFSTAVQSGFGAIVEDNSVSKPFENSSILNGWVVTEWNDLSKPAADNIKWSVKDGILRSGDLRGTWLVSEKEYGDLILEFEILLTEVGNSGIALRAPMHGDPAFDGMEMQFADFRYNPQAKDSELTGGIYRAIAPSKQVYKPTEWNTCRIELKGMQLRVTINSELIQDVDLTKYDQPIPRHDGSLALPIKDRPKRGHIGFQHLSRSNEPVQIRNVRITELDDQSNSTAKMSADEIFNRRMLPILRSDKSSSCSECHFGGVDLRNYLREDQADMFASLRDQGLIDVKDPDQSKILQFISRHTDKTDELTERVRKSEFSAFRDWIRAAVNDPKLMKSRSSTVKIGTEMPVDLIRHLRRDHVLNSFVEDIWSEIGRCINCHSPDRNQRLIKEHGEQMSWIVPNDPAATLEKLVDGGNIDLDDPEKSSVLQKPAGLEKHGGGPKFTLGSRSDKNFRVFLTDYAATKKGTYKSVDQLPKPRPDVAMLTEQHLRIVDLPKGLDKKILQVNIYPWDGDHWSSEIWGTSQNPINGEKNEWQNLVSEVAKRDSDRAKEMQSGKCRIPRGRYLVKIYVDKADRTIKQRDSELSETEFIGQVEIDGDWPPGYLPPKIIQAPN